MKTILSRTPNSLQAVDPQYRDLIYKNQQLNEMKNKREFELNNMKKSIEDNERIMKKISDERKDINQMEKDNKRKAQLQKQQDKLQAKKDDAQFKRDTLDKKNEIGKAEQEIQKIDFIMKQLDRENEVKRLEIKENQTFQNLQLKKKELETLQQQRDALDQVLKSEEYQHANMKYVKALKEEEINKIHFKEQQELLKKRQELRDLQAEVLSAQKVEEYYTTRHDSI